MGCAESSDIENEIPKKAQDISNTAKNSDQKSLETSENKQNESNDLKQMPVSSSGSSPHQPNPLKNEDQLDNKYTARQIQISDYDYSYTYSDFGNEI